MADECTSPPNDASTEFSAPYLGVHINPGYVQSSGLSETVPSGGVEGQPEFDGETTGDDESDDKANKNKPASNRPRKPHLQGRFSGRLATKDDEKKLAEECKLIGPLLGGVGKRGDKSRLTLAKIVRGIASGEIRQHCEERERRMKCLKQKVAMWEEVGKQKIDCLQLENAALRAELEIKARQIVELDKERQLLAAQAAAGGASVGEHRSDHDSLAAVLAAAGVVPGQMHSSLVPSALSLHVAPLVSQDQLLQREQDKLHNLPRPTVTLEGPTGNSSQVSTLSRGLYGGARHVIDEIRQSSQHGSAAEQQAQLVGSLATSLKVVQAAQAAAVQAHTLQAQAQAHAQAHAEAQAQAQSLHATAAVICQAQAELEQQINSIKVQADRLQTLQAMPQLLQAEAAAQKLAVQAQAKAAAALEVSAAAQRCEAQANAYAQAHAQAQAQAQELQAKASSLQAAAEQMQAVKHEESMEAGSGQPASAAGTKPLTGMHSSSQPMPTPSTGLSPFLSSSCQAITFSHILGAGSASAGGTHPAHTFTSEQGGGTNHPRLTSALASAGGSTNTHGHANVVTTGGPMQGGENPSAALVGHTSANPSHTSPGNPQLMSSVSAPHGHSPPLMGMNSGGQRPQAGVGGSQAMLRPMSSGPHAQGGQHGSTGGGKPLLPMSSGPHAQSSVPMGLLSMNSSHGQQGAPQLRTMASGPGQQQSAGNMGGLTPPPGGSGSLPGNSHGAGHLSMGSVQSHSHRFGSDGGAGGGTSGGGGGGSYGGGMDQMRGQMGHGNQGGSRGSDMGSHGGYDPGCSQPMMMNAEPASQGLPQPKGSFGGASSGQVTAMQVDMAMAGMADVNNNRGEESGAGMQSYGRDMTTELQGVCNNAQYQMRSAMMGDPNGMQTGMGRLESLDFGDTGTGQQGNWRCFDGGD